jgi:hypothetical protein
MRFVYSRLINAPERSAPAAGTPDTIKLMASDYGATNLHQRAFEAAPASTLRDLPAPPTLLLHLEPMPMCRLFGA